MKRAKTTLKGRWKDSDFLNSLPIDNQSIKVEFLNNLDLQGVPKLGCGEPLWKFPDVYSSEVYHLNLSFGDGALTVADSKITDLKCIEFKFDQASSFRKSTFFDSFFTRAKLKFNATDVEFHRCDFSESMLKGGFHEYGFRRCKFFSCRFSSAQWQNTYLFACRFIDCDFTDFKVLKSAIKGFKVNTAIDSVFSVFEDCEIDGLVKEYSYKL